MTQIRADFKCQSRISSQSRGVGSVISDLETLPALVSVAEHSVFFGRIVEARHHGINDGSGSIRRRRSPRGHLHVPVDVLVPFGSNGAVQSHVAC